MKTESKSITQAEKTNKPGIARVKTKRGTAWLIDAGAVPGINLLPTISGIEKAEPLLSESVAFYPFSDRFGINIKLDYDQQSLFRDTCGWPVKTSALKSYLKKNCKFTSFENETILDVLSALKLHIQSEANTPAEPQTEDKIPKGNLNKRPQAQKAVDIVLRDHPHFGKLNSSQDDTEELMMRVNTLLKSWNQKPVKKPTILNDKCRSLKGKNKKNKLQTS